MRKLTVSIFIGTIAGLTTYAILKYFFKQSLEKPNTPSDSAEEE